MLAYIFGEDPVDTLLGMRDMSKTGFAKEMSSVTGEQQARILTRQKLYHKQRNALFRLGSKISRLSNAAVCIVTVPESLNAAVFSTHGTFNDFMRAFAASLKGMRARKSARLRASVTDTWLRFSQTSSTNCTKPFDTLFAALTIHTDSDLLNRARRTLDDENALAPSESPLTPANSRLPRAISAALQSYVGTANTCSSGGASASAAVGSIP